MNIEQFRKALGTRTRVRYIPGIAYGDRNHPDCEDGVVTLVGTSSVFVKFNQAITRFGIDNVTAQACSPEDLVFL